MSDATFSIDLALSGKADSKEAAQNIDKLRSSLEANTKSIAKMQLAYRNMKVGGLQTSDAAKELKKKLDATKKVVGENQAALLKMKGGLGAATAETKKFGAASKGASSLLGRLNTGIQAGGGPVADLAGKTSGLASVLGKAGLAGALVAGIAAVVALDVVVVKATMDLAKMAITSADAYRSENLALQGMTKAWVGYYGQVKAGKAGDVQSAIDDVSSSVALGRDKVEAYAQSLYRSRLRGEALKQALLGVSMASSAAGEEYGEVAKNMVVSSAMWGRSVTATVDNFKARFGGIVSKQMLALPTQINKARENFSALFRDININPVLSGLDSVLGIINQTSVEFKAWKAIFETLFNPLFAGAEQGGSVIRAFLDKVTIMALNAAIAWEDLRGSFSLKDSGIESTASLLSVAASASSTFAIGVLRSAQATIILSEALLQLGKVWWAVSQLGWHVQTGQIGKVGADIKAVGASLSSAFAGAKTANSGVQMLEGVIEGIRAAQPRLNAAIKASAEEANKTFKATQDIHSPSRVWRGFGRQLPAGAAIGVRQGTPEFARATTALGSVPSAQPAMGGFGGGARAAASRPSVSVGQLILQGVQSGPGAGMVTVPIAELRSWLASILEGVVIQAGGEV